MSIFDVVTDRGQRKYRVADPVSLEDEPLNPDRNWGIRMMVLCIVFGAIGLVFICITLRSDTHPFGTNFGLFSAISIAALLSGGFLGFLFGIPKSKQKSSTGIQAAAAATTTSPAAPATNASPQPQTTAVATDATTQDNTNLEEISDWLTKIIVGVSLVQINRITAEFNIMVSKLVEGFGEAEKPLAWTFVACLIIYFLIAGFMILYLWARVYLKVTLSSIERYMNASIIKKVIADQEIGKKNIQQAISGNLDLKIESLQSKKEFFTRQRTRIYGAEANLKNIIAAAKPEPVTVIDDPQKFRWGKSSVNNGFKISASYVRDEESADTFEATLTVEAINKSADSVTGQVYFFLHDSYCPNNIVDTSAADGKASTSFQLVEASTVGAYILDRNTKLELDLNLTAETPEELKYDDELTSIHDLEASLKELIELKSAVTPQPQKNDTPLESN